MEDGVSNLLAGHAAASGQLDAAEAYCIPATMVSQVKEATNMAEIK